MAQAQQTMNFELVSPEAKLVSEPVRLAVIPGMEGEMGVGAGHAAFVVALKPGVVELFKPGSDQSQRIFITGGFADVTGKSCIVLAEEAVNVSSLNQSEAEQQLSDLNEDLGAAKDPVEKSRVERKITVAKAKIQAITGKLVV